MSDSTLTKTLNQFFVPWALRDTAKLRPDLGLHMATLALGFGGGAYGLRRLSLALQAADVKKAEKRLKEYAGARYPVLSVDPDIQDTEEEQALKELGVTEQKALPELSKEAVEGVSRAVEATEAPSYYLAAALAAAALGGGAGWRLADYMVDTKRNQELEKRIQSRQNQLDKLLYDEYMRARGLSDEAPIEKSAADKGDTWAPFQRRDASEQEHDFDFMARPREYTAHALGSLAVIYALAMWYASHRVSKEYFAHIDPSRRRYKDLKEVAKQRARVQDAPVFLSEDGALPALGTTAKARRKPKIESISTEETPAITDTTDPNKDLLAI